jgi:hypothetical protein
MTSKEILTYKITTLRTMADAPPCPDCGTCVTAWIETTNGNWQLLCMECLQRWGTDWRGTGE